MKESIKWSVAVVIVGILAFIGGKLTAPQGFSTNTGAVGNNYIERYDTAILYNGGYNSQLPVKTSSSIQGGTVQVGSSGTALSNLISTSCNLIGTDVSQAASSTAAYDCAVTGVTSSDNVIAILASTTVRNGGAASWEIVASKASTTAGYVTVLLSNNGPAQIPSVTSVGSSTQLVISH